jgi:SNF2 family DNA or RNA helicase
MVQLLEILSEYIEDEGYIFRKLIGSTASEVRLYLPAAQRL